MCVKVGPSVLTLVSSGMYFYKVNKDLLLLKQGKESIKSKSLLPLFALLHCVTFKNKSLVRV